MLVSELKSLTGFAIELMYLKANKILEGASADGKFEFKKNWTFKHFGVDKPMMGKVYEILGLALDKTFLTTYSDEYGNYGKNFVWGPKVCLNKDGKIVLTVGFEEFPLEVTKSNELVIIDSGVTMAIVKQSAKTAQGVSYSKLFASLFVTYTKDGNEIDASLDFPLICENNDNVQHDVISNAWSKRNPDNFRNTLLSNLKVVSKGGFVPDICDINKLLYPIIEQGKFKPITIPFNGFTINEITINASTNPSTVVKYYLNVDTSPIVNVYGDYEVQGFKVPIKLSQIKKVAVGASSLGSAPLAMLDLKSRGLLMIQAPNSKNPKFAPKFTLIAHQDDVKAFNEHQNTLEAKTEPKAIQAAAPQVVVVDQAETEFAGF